MTHVADGSIEATVDAEALQEILHRYRAIGRWKDGRLIYDAARVLFTTLAVKGEVTDRARVLLDGHSQLMARDAVHAAVVEIYGLESICSFDRDFD